MDELQERVEKLLNDNDYTFLTGDVSWLKYGGKFIENLDDENYHIIDIMIQKEYFREPQSDYIVYVSTVSLDDNHLNSALEFCGYNEETYKKITNELKIEALHSYHGGDTITYVEGNKIYNMVEWIIGAGRIYPHIEEYTEHRLFRLFMGNINNRSEFYRVKAKDISDVIKWIQSDEAGIFNFEEIPEEHLIEEIEEIDDSNALINLNGCIECDNYSLETYTPINPEICELDCMVGTLYIQIEEIDEPLESDYQFRVYPFGQNNYKDLMEE
jgi:hypothetical protein